MDPCGGDCLTAAGQLGVYGQGGTYMVARAAQWPGMQGVCGHGNKGNETTATRVPQPTCSSGCGG